MRADAERNRARIVDAARAVFQERGVNAPLDDVVKAAGVGAGTLYRHFPAREDLIEAVMAPWVQQVETDAAEVLAAGGSSREMLLNWFGRYVALISVHKGGAARIVAGFGDPRSCLASTCEVLDQATGRVIAGLATDGRLKTGVDTLGLNRLVGSVAISADIADLPAEAVRPLLEVIADGSLER